MYLALTALMLLVLVFFLTSVYYYIRLKKVAIENNGGEKENNDVSQELNSLLNSLNDIIFEFDENKVCLNVWFNDSAERVIDPKLTIGKRLAELIGPEKAKKFDDALDYVTQHKKSTSLEYISDFGTGEWFIAKMTPVFDRAGNYTSRISASLTNISEQKKYAEALKENEFALIEAQSIAKAGNWWYDYETKETYWSKNLYSILELDELAGDVNKFEVYMQLVYEDDREDLNEYLTSIRQKTDDVYYEHRIVTPNGNLKYLKILKGGSSNVNGIERERISGIVQDITESKLSEKEIKQSRAELIEAQTIAKIGNWKWDRASKTVVWSDEIANMFEIDQLEVGQYETLKILLKNVDKTDRFILHYFLKSLIYNNNYSFVFRITTPSAAAKYLRVIVGKQMTREDGSIKKVIGTLQDITERKETEIAFKRTENKYKLVLENIKLAALSLDNNGSVIFCNQYLANLLGYDQSEILGKNWLDFIPSDEREVINDWYAHNNFEAQYINPVICRNGEQRIISWQNTVVYDDYNLIKESTSLGEDITDQQKATLELISAKELAERSSEFKSEFLSIMSHEIRTPMNAVIGTTNLLLSEDPKPDQLEYLNILKFSADNLLAIINDILDYNKIEAGKLELYITRFNLYNLVQKIKKSFYSKAVEKLLDIELVIDDTIPEFVMGDQMRLSQILNNLVSNAVKFTQKGKIVIQLDNDFTDDRQISIKFTVIDTGIGIAAENLRMIFDPFMQESQFINSHTGGTGLGLAITKRLIQLHKSDIHVLSELGKGTQFMFTILFELMKPYDDDKLAPDDDTGPMLNLHGMNILLVDDNRMNLLIAATFLRKWQANVEEAEHGQIAVDMVNFKQYDLVIMDLQMPVMDGFTATKIIKEAYPQLPVIALTADAMPETYAKAIDIGMSDYLTKPFVPAVLFEKVSQFYNPV